MGGYKNQLTGKYERKYPSKIYVVFLEEFYSKM